MKELYFISKDARWQKYRYDVLTAFASKHNYKITILTDGPVADYLTNSASLEYKIFNSWFPSSWRISFFPGALLYTLQRRPDCVLALSNASQFTEYVGLVICRLFRIRFVFWTHGYDHGTRPIGKVSRILDRLRVAYMERFLSLSNAIITFSQSGRNYLVAKNVKKDADIVCAPNTLNTERLDAYRRNIGSDRVGLRNELQVSPEGFVLLFSGRIYKDKGLIEAIEAFEIATTGKCNVSFIIMGDGAEKKALERYVVVQGIGNVRFISSIFSEEESSKWFAAADVLLMPGSVGLAIVHGFIFGLPIITMESGTHGPEIQFLRNWHNGFIVERDSVKQLAEKIRLLIDNRALLEEMSSNAMATARNEASINTMIDAMNRAITR